MSKRTKHGLFLTILASTVVVGWVLLAKSSFTVARPQGDEPAAAPDAGIADVGPFKLGYQRGLERASFTGRPMVQVFVPDQNPLVLQSLTPVLTDLKVVAAMASFTGVIVPVPPEPQLTERELQAQFEAHEAQLQAAIEADVALPEVNPPPRFPDNDLPTIVIKVLSGPITAVLSRESLSVDSLIEALESTSAQYPIVKSPLLEMAEEDTSVFARLVAEGEIDTVRIARESLTEIAPQSAALIAATEALAKVGR